MASVAPTDAPGLLEASSGPSPIAWVLHDGKAGMTSQALGLAEATGFPFIEKCLGSGTAKAGMTAFVVYVGIVAVTLAIFLFAPQVDLATSGLFYQPERGFVLASWPPIVLLSHAIPRITWGTLILIAVAASRLLFLGRPLWRLDRKALIFLVAATAVGPGLFANTLLKDHWGRARPVQIEAFGGVHRFTPAPLPAAECERNCAFV